MRMLFIMGSSLALTLGLRIVDPPVASAISPTATVQATDILVVPAPRAGRQRQLIAIVADNSEPGGRHGSRVIRLVHLATEHNLSLQRVN